MLESLPEIPCVHGLVYLELIQGCGNKDEVTKVESLVTPMQMVWPIEADYAAVRQQFADLHLRASVGLLDVLIGMSCARRNDTLCTHNIKHYRHISGLETEQPYRKPERR